jgi:hypothetical protein
LTEETKDKTREDKTAHEAVDPKERTTTEKMMAFAEALKKRAVEVDKWATEQKNFSASILVDLVHSELETLKEYIENPAEKEVSWFSPWVESRFRVLWDWDEGGLVPPGPVGLPPLVYDALTKGADPEELASHPEVVEIMTGRLAASHPQRLLFALTNKAAVHTKDGKTAGVSFHDPEVKKELGALPTEEERTARIEELLRPWCMGGRDTKDEEGRRLIIANVDPLPSVDEDPRPGGRFVRLTRITGKFTVSTSTEGEDSGENSRMTFQGVVRGVQYQGSVVFIVHPLVVDEDKREAYFPIVTGLVFAPAEAHHEPVDLNASEKYFEAWDPVTWTEEERSKLWDLLLVNLIGGLRKEFAVDYREIGEKTEPVIPPLHEPGAERPSWYPRPLVPAGPPPPERRYLLDAPTRIDRGAAVLVAHTGGLNLPRDWKKVKKWEDFAKEEVERLQETYGDKAFQDQRRETKDPNAPGRLLRKTTNDQGEEETKLTTEAEDALLESVGHKGFRKIVQDPDGVKREYLIKRFRAGSGYLEVRLSWYNAAWPLVEGGVENKRTDLEALREELRQGALFEKMDHEIQEKLNSGLRVMESIRDAREVMGAILSAFGAVGENPLRVPAWNLRKLLECEKDPDGFRRVRGCLRALQEVRFTSKASKIPGFSSREKEGHFISGLEFVYGGPGRHTDGDFIITLDPMAVGCLKVFETTHYKLRDPYKVLEYDWGKSLTKEEKEDLKSGYLHGFSSLAPYYDRAKGFTPAQSHLRQWIEHNVTLNKDGRKKGSPSVRVAKNAKNANEPRRYDRRFCPILPEGHKFHGVFGHFREGKGERGRKLYGTPTAPTKTSGPHTAGLLPVMGYSLPPGAATSKRRDMVRKALQDMRAVVEEAFGGMVMALLGDRWLPLKEAEKLPVDTLLKRVSWYLFLASGWRDRIPQAVEDYHAKRRARGEVDYEVKVTKDRDLVERAEAQRGLSAEAIGIEKGPLSTRLYIARKEKKLSQAAVGRLFGVSQAAVNYWERGMEPDEKGKGRGKPIPPDVAPLILQWVETGVEPTAEELAVLKVRRERRPGTRKGGL